MRSTCQKTSAHWSDKLNASEGALTLRRAGIGALLVSIIAGMTSNLLFLAAFSFGWTGFWRRRDFLGPALHRPSCSGGRQFSISLAITSLRRSSGAYCGGNCGPESPC